MMAPSCDGGGVIMHIGGCYLYILAGAPFIYVPRRYLFVGVARGVFYVVCLPAQMYH